MALRPRLLAFAALAAASIPALAQSTASANASISATIIQPISISKTADLAFGAIVPGGNSPGTVTITPGGTPSASSGITLLTGSRTAAQFTVGGQASYAYLLDIPASGTLTGTNPSNTMALTFQGQLDNGPANLSGTNLAETMPAGGSSTLHLGAILTVSNTQAADTYSGSVTVTVHYQ